MMSSRALPAATALSLGLGAATMASLALGLRNLGSVAAFVHQCFVVGLPFAVVLGDRLLRTRRAVVALSFALSMALSAVAAQVLIMFSAAGPLWLVGSATLYGVGLAQIAGAAMTRPGGESFSDDDSTETGSLRDTRELATPRPDHGAVSSSPPRLHNAGRGATGRFLSHPAEGDADQ